jgi:hypothetical protein
MTREHGNSAKCHGFCERSAKGPWEFHTSIMSLMRGPRKDHEKGEDSQGGEWTHKGGSGLMRGGVDS